MFTGIVEELGSVRAVTPSAGGSRLEITSARVLEDAALGASISVNGCCLTVIEIGKGWWAADAVTETLERSTLGLLSVGDPVNLERPVRALDRLGGHIVQGHVDGVGVLLERTELPDLSVRIRVEVADALGRYVVEKGSIALDGVSLTVAALTDNSDAAGTATTVVDVAVIPHTLASTTLGAKGPGDPVNLEVDVLAKHVERLLLVDNQKIQQFENRKG
ncbi:MAG: riboflavin synthase [Acidimicrobiia bacterium]|nr:riboflavin synthase [Acidimicrobiia bacterium]